MRMIQTLDCTLRDGGYCNDWIFGRKIIRETTLNLIEAGIDFIEFGLLSDQAPNNPESTYYPSFLQMDDMRKLINTETNHNISSKLLCMINHGDFDISKLPNKYTLPLGGIRYAFHRKDLYNIFESIIQLKKKGIPVFLQPMQTSRYTSEELSYLINISNELKVFSVYIVDSFGSICTEDLFRILSLFDNLLLPEIKIGFHSHNNLLQAYDNTCSFIKYECNHSIIVDSCLAGIGRGAGNTKTEQICAFINELQHNRFNLSNIKEAKELILNNLNPTHPWGWSKFFFLSAIHDSHPNYALFFQEHGVELNIANSFFSSLSEEKKEQFDLKYVSSWIKRVNNSL